ncbi:MAG TPA: hypothetical protein VNZ45_08815, partial [Bacteroidia bacterium]|nr:hypothetical protein [Bacteroidia bacterium]
MKKIIFLLLFPIWCFGQVTPDANILSNTNTWIRLASPVQKVNHATINDQLTLSSLKRVEANIATGTNTYAISLSWFTSGDLRFGLQFPLYFTNGNSGASTLSVNGGAAIPITKNGTTVLTGGEISAGQQFNVFYDGTEFLINTGGNAGMWGGITGDPNNQLDLQALLKWKIDCRVATTVNITLSGTQTIDGVSVSIGDRVLVKNQSTTANNGIYIVALFGWGRSSDASTSSQLSRAVVQIITGSQGGTVWLQNNIGLTVGTSAINWIQQYPNGSVSVRGLNALYTGTGSATDGGVDQNTFTNAIASFISLPSLSATSPLFYNNGTGNFTIQQSTTSQNGYLSNTDWNTFNSKQSAITFGTGVQTALGVNIGSAGAPILFNGAAGTPSSLNLSNAVNLPISGIASLGANVGTYLATPSISNFANTVANQTANTFWAAPNGSSGAISMRTIVSADIPTLNQNTTGSAAKWTSPITISGVSVDGSANVNIILQPTAVKTSNYTAVRNDFVPADITSSWTLTLPTAPTDGTQIGVKIVAPSSPTNSLTINCGGSDVINISGTTSLSLTRTGQEKIFQYKSSTA